MKLASELEFDLPDTVEKLSWFGFEQSYYTGAIDMKIDRSVLEEKSSFKMLVLSSKLD